MKNKKYTITLITGSRSVLLSSSGFCDVDEVIAEELKKAIESIDYGGNLCCRGLHQKL